MFAPAALIITMLVAYPIVSMANFAFQDLKLTDIRGDSEAEYTISNFEKLLTDSRTAETLRTTAVYVIFSTGVAFFWGLATALLLDKAFPGRRALQTLIVSPWAIASVVASLSWMFLLNSQTGVINYMLLATGLSGQPINFLGNHIWAMVSVIFVTAWKSYPFFTVMLIAQLKAVPRDTLDSARVDGAGSVRRFFAVKLPVLRPVIAIALTLSMLTSFREIETIYVFTGGGPGRATETAAVAIYNQAFRFFNVGYASALGVILFLIVLVLAFFSLRILESRESQ
ncbi:MAG: ABC transporter permease subunit [Spirochaetes bacterium]|jgi:multiple sugar transport system permease protein|nr:ABC transporter permease subunit [Spirochaetota bacterium]